MLRCTRCEGFIPAAVSACPNCSRFVPRGRAGTGFLAVIGAAGAALTLMACYGTPPCTPQSLPDGGTTRCEAPPVEDAGVTDAGTKDAGTCDAGTADGGC